MTKHSGHRVAAAWLTLSGVAAVAHADVSDVVVTATRTGLPAEQVPAAVTVISAPELATQDSPSLATALRLVPGVEAPAGGDAGPSSAVPAFWGLHEFDAFLLVVDGVPWGGAFNPAITSLNLHHAMRVEVLKGAAPVMYGATAFVGVVQVLHFPAGEAPEEVEFAVGSHDSLRGGGSWVLPTIGGLRHSLSVDGQDQGYSDQRERVRDGHVLYRGRIDMGGGTFRVDLNLTHVADVPQSPVLRDGTALGVLTSRDANFNPADARIDESKVAVALGYSRPLTEGAWDTLISIAHSDVADIRAFLHPDDSGTADTQNQRRHLDDDYVDSHVNIDLGRNAALVAGADLLYGKGRQTTLNGNDAYTVPLNGSVLPPSTAYVAVSEAGVIDDRRLFTGQYAELNFKPGTRWDVLGGVRLNETSEAKTASDLVLRPVQYDAATARQSVRRLTESLGLSFRAWREGRDEIVVFADARNSFKPAAIDFGPDYTPDLLRPETAVSTEAGLKGVAGAGRLTFQAAVFQLDFKNLVVATDSGALANAAGERLRGIEMESRYALRRDLALAMTASYHDARYSREIYEGGATPVDVSGRNLPLSPHVLAAAGVLFTPPRGLNLTVVARYVGRRFLDEKNAAPSGGYTSWDATAGYAVGPWRVSLDAGNLTNRRPPVTASEFGSQSFYLLPGRMLWLRLGRTWR